MSGYSPFQGPFFDAAGDPLAAGKLHTYVAGSSTDQATYQDSALTTAHANPIILDAEGKPPADIWFLSNTTYKLALVNSADVSQTGWPKDNILGIESVAGSEWLETGLPTTYISTTQFSIPGDHTLDYFEAGRRIKVSETAGTVYGRVTASSFATSITTVTVVLDSGVLDSGISSTHVGLNSITNNSIDYLAVDRVAGLPAANAFTGANTFSVEQTFNHLVTMEKGADIASATTVDLTAATGNLVHITGTTTSTGLTLNSGQQMELIADAAWPLTYNATTMKINGGVSYTCAAGDRLLAFYDGTTTFVNVVKQDGTAVVSAASDPLSANTLESKTTDQPTVFEDDSSREIGQLCTSWVSWTNVTTTVIHDSFNVSSLTDNGTGDTTVNFANTMADSDYVVAASGTPDTASVSAGGWFTGVRSTSGVPTTKTTSAVRIYNLTQAAGAYDAAYVGIAIHGGI